MKQTVLAALLAAVAASALTLLLAAGLRREAGPTTAAEFKSALADLVGEVAALRKDLAAERKAAAAPVPMPALATAAPPPAEMTPAAPAPGELVLVPDAPAEQVPATEEFVPPKERSAIARPAELVERIRGLTKWSDSADIRARWILASEEAVVSSFGKPDEIWIQDGGAESWFYRTLTGNRDEDGDPEWQDIVFEMNRGRLVRVDD